MRPLGTLMRAFAGPRPVEAQPRATAIRTVTLLAAAWLTSCDASSNLVGGTTRAEQSAPSAASGDPIKIGVIEPLTGPLANVGKDVVDGFKLYFSLAGQTAAGRKIEPIVADSQGQADVGLTKAQQLVASGAEVLTGITATPVCYAIAGYAGQAHIPLVVTGGCAAQGLTTDPRFASPYLVRLAVTSTELGGPPADWAYRQGYRRAIIVVSDYGGGLEVADAFARAFMERGGAIVQEMYPTLGTADFGPFAARLDPSADVLFTVLGGMDGQRFLDQYGSYAGDHRPPIIDGLGSMTDGPNFGQLQAKALGVVGANLYSEAVDSPQNRAFLTAFHRRYPGRYVSGNVALGYTGAQVLAAAIERVHGNVEQGQAFLGALYDTSLVTARGPLRLNHDHDVVQDIYLFQVDQGKGGFGPKLLQTYTDVGPAWDSNPSAVARFPFGHLKGQWVGMTKERLGQLSSG